MSLVISIDLWGTLIKSSPLFVEAKIALTKKYFPKPQEHILWSYDIVKKQLNCIIEDSGMQPSEITIFNLLFTKINGGYDSFTFLTKFIHEYQGLAVEFAPEIYSEETVEYLFKLSQIGKLYLSSNTLFINGSSLKKILDKNKMSYLFEKFYFSDEIGVSKPDKRMFGNSDFHIGDNPLTDWVGADTARSIPFIINSNTKTIKDAYDFIVQGR